MNPARPPLRELLPLVFAGPARPALEALGALDAELRAAVRPTVDHGVAHAKLGWWREEIRRLAAGRPEHPLVRRLRAAAGAAPADWSLLGERLAAAELTLGGIEPSTPQALEALLYRSHGSHWQLAAQLLAGRRSEALSAWGAALGKGLGLADHRATLAGAVAEEAAARAHALLAAAEAALAPGDRAALAAGAVAAALARLRLARPPDAAEPAAVRQLVHAWRAARRAHRE